jgi:hypothetical protein
MGRGCARDGGHPHLWLLGRFLPRSPCNWKVTGSSWAVDDDGCCQGELLLTGICRVPPRRAGNFHLRPQMKVTKAKGLNAKPFGSFFTLRRIGPAGHLDTAPAIELSAHSAGLAARFGLSPTHVRWVTHARYSDACAPSAMSLRYAARVPSGPPGACPKRDAHIQAPLSLLTFFLARQKESMPPAGAGPGTEAVSQGKPHRPASAACASASTEPRYASCTRALARTASGVSKAITSP